MEFTEKLKKVFKENHIEILSYTNEKAPIKYKCLDCGKIYEYKCARNLLSKITLCKDCYNPFGRWNKKRMQEKLNRIFPNSSLELIEFTTLRRGGRVKCQKCGEIETIKNFEALLAARSGSFCNNCEKDKDRTFKHLEQELKKGNLELLQWNGVNEKAKFKCLRCGHVFDKVVRTNFDGNICPNCFKAHNKFSFEAAQKFLDEKGNSEYTLLQYKGNDSKSLIKHKCGFCFSTRLADFGKTRGCPKCYRKISQGEQKVIKFLQDKDIPFIYQKRFSDLKPYSFDFEIQLNTQKILLEVQGRQHYENVEIFDDIKIQKRRDKIKREYCLVNNIPLIEIPYWEINNLENFLQLKFNDYLN